MFDTVTQTKKSSSVWKWVVVGLIILGATAYFVSTANAQTTQKPAQAPAPTNQTPNIVIVPVFEPTLEAAAHPVTVLFFDFQKCVADLVALKAPWDKASDRCEDVRKEERKRADYAAEQARKAREREAKERERTAKLLAIAQNPCLGGYFSRPVECSNPYAVLGGGYVGGQIITGGAVIQTGGVIGAQPPNTQGSNVQIRYQVPITPMPTAGTAANIGYVCNPRCQ